MRAFKDLTNRNFGKLTVIERSGKGSPIKWGCLCDCGNYTIVIADNLRGGHTKSCGCLRKEVPSTHGKSKHPLYWTWTYMKQRCGITKPQKRDREYYVSRGITICDEWLDFLTFYKWAKDKWRKGLQLDREDNDGNYTPDNCRFVTHKVNQQNTRKSKRWFVNEKKYNSLWDAATALGVDQATVRVWCDGYIRDGTYRPPKANCYSVKLY